MATKNSLTIELNGQDIALEIQGPVVVKTVQLKPPPKLLFPEVGRCIYCGSTQALSDEHLIPYGLSGEHVLRKASCADCARETCRFEQLVLRGPMRAARLHRRLKSRTKHSEASSTQRMVLVGDSGESSVDLPLADYPILLHFPIFTPAGYFTGEASPGIRMEGIHTILFGPRPEDVAKAHGVRQIRFPATKEQPTAFARMLAKIAYGYAVATGDILHIQEPSPVLPCIRGIVDDVGQWVFTAAGDTVAYPGALHRVVMHELHGSLVAEVHLFADSETPKYGVVLGRLRAS